MNSGKASLHDSLNSQSCGVQPRKLYATRTKEETITAHYFHITKQFYSFQVMEQ